MDLFTNLFMYLLIIKIILNCINYVISAPVNNTEATYILATVLFYKDDKGRIMIASGPVPQITNYAIKDDVISRIDGATVKVVPIFNEKNLVPRSLDILDFVKDEYETVFITEIPKRLSRNFVEDLWHYYWHGMWGKSKSKRRTTVPNNSTRMINRVKQPVGYREIRITEGTETNERSSNITIFINGTTTETSISINDEAEVLKDVEDSNNNEAKVLTSADEFIPNDIYYGIEKKCVNWSDGCDLKSKNVLNMSSHTFRYVYKRPRIVQWGP